jgi:hypothetical protein
VSTPENGQTSWLGNDPGPQTIKLAETPAPDSGEATQLITLPAGNETGVFVLQPGEEPPIAVPQAEGPVNTVAPEPYTGEEWTTDALRAELHRVNAAAGRQAAMFSRLRSWIFERMPDEVDPEHEEVDVVGILLRVFDPMLADPKGALAPAVRLVVDQLENLPAGDLQDMVDLATSVRVTLRHALISGPRPGGGPAPVYESDDLAMVRFDRDRFRSELDLSYQTMAQMYAAATGTSDGPQRGLVEDLDDVRMRREAAERGLRAALSHSCDGSPVLLVRGSPQHEQLKALIADTVKAMADAQKLAPGRPS